MLTKKQAIIALSIFLLVVSAGALYFLKNAKENQSKLQKAAMTQQKFVGKVVSVSGTQIVVDGLYSGGDAETKSQQITIHTDQNTKVNKDIAHWPDWDDLAANGQTSGKLNLKDLPHTRGESTMTELADYLDEGISISIEASFSYPDPKQNPLAFTISYQSIVMPPEGN